MAKPISATPTLVGREAIAFLNKMKKNNHAMLSKVDKCLLDIIVENREFFKLAKSNGFNNLV